MGEYNEKSCNALEKPFYRPVEAAIRWCGLIEHEAKILTKLGDDAIPKTSMFPQWPCLQANTEKILDATTNGDLPRGRDGQTVICNKDQIARARLTVRHTDLREWMAKNYPDQKPAFLFDEIERNTHAAIDAKAFLALQVEQVATRSEIKALKEREAVIVSERDALIGERDALLAKSEKGLNTTERNSLLVIIAALCEYSAIKHQERGVAKRIMEMTDEIGAHLDDETILTALKKIPNALEARMK
ncbi:MAG: hypothetical protein PHV02_18815 [Rhodocyclaceae bacterium]|nr:hypothetical protein [Rhodocyclaceae bacterium]